MTYPLTATGYRPPAIGTPFAAGYEGARGLGSPGLAEQSARWTAMSKAAGTQPHSIEQQISSSPIAANLSAPSQRDRLLPNGYRLPNLSNSASSGTERAAQQLRMRDLGGAE